MKNLHLITLCLLISIKISTGQEFINNDLFRISYEHGFYSKAKNYDYNLSKKHFYADFSIPFNLKTDHDHLYLIGGYSFNQLNNDFYQNDKLNLHTISLALGWYKSYKNPFWAHYLEFSIGLGSDLKSFTKNHGLIDLTTVFYYGKSDKFIFHFGLNYNTGTYGHWISPLMGFNSNLKNGVFISLDIFNEFYFEYHPINNFSLGVELYSNPFSFGITNYFEYENSALYSYGEKYLDIPYKANLFVNFHINDKWIIFVKPGIDINNQYYHYDQFNTIINESAYNDKTTVPISLEVGLRLKGDVIRSIKF